MKTVHRYTVPIDDEWHDIEMSGYPLAVAVPKEMAYLEFWAEAYEGRNTMRRFRVFGTGHPIPMETSYCGTAPRVLGLVFHLYEYTL